MSAPCHILPATRQKSRQCGSGLAGFAVAALPVLFLGLGSAEVAHWFFTRQAISLALLEAGRAAITDHNRPEGIIRAFEHALLPLYGTRGNSGNSSNSSDTGSRHSIRRLQHALAQRQYALSDAPWQIDVLSPSAAAWRDFADSTLRIDGARGRAAINNHYLAEQDQRYRTRGWPEGRGPVSGQTVFEANTLVMRLTWPHRPRLPLVVPILRAMGRATGSYRQRALAAGFLPMERQITLIMQSHPVLWGNSPDGKVLFHAEGQLPPVCRGWLCNAGSSAPRIPGTGPDDDISHSVKEGSGGSGPGPGSGSGAAPGTGSGPGSSSGPGSQADDGTGPPVSDGPGHAIDPDDPACGVVFCCL